MLNYTHAYSTFAIRSCLNPELPNNTGSLAPIKVHAPEGSIVNCKYPAPVTARHVVGMYVPMPILKALYQVMPDRVLAEGSGAVWTMQIQGKRADGQPFTSSMFNYSGGMGARATKPGPSATCYPTGVAAVPVEIVEAVTPVIFDRKELRPGSGGDGAMRGGDGQIIQFRHADQGRVAAQCGGEPRRGGPGRSWRRRAGRGRQVSHQWQAGARRQEAHFAAATTSYCSKRRAAAATDALIDPNE